VKIAILGCGPAGLLAAHAARICTGKDGIEIFSNKVRSSIHGAQVLHRPIVGMTNDEADGECLFAKIGSADNYAMKVYGHKNAPTSWDDYPGGMMPIWSMQYAYGNLWYEYEDLIRDIEITDVFIDFLAKNDYQIFNTVPLKVLDQDETAVFTSQDVWISDSLPGTDLGLTNVENVIWYNGNRADDWYRASKIFGCLSTEYGKETPRTVKITKPLSTNFSRWPSVHRLGRYGKWKKGELVHHAFEDVMRILK
jgi:hypothetical protein